MTETMEENRNLQTQTSAIQNEEQKSKENLRKFTKISFVKRKMERT